MTNNNNNDNLSPTNNIINCENILTQYPGHHNGKLYVYSHFLRSYPEQTENISQEYLTLHNELLLPLLSVLWTGIINSLPPVGSGNQTSGSASNPVLSVELIYTIADHLFLISQELTMVFHAPGGKVQPDLSAVVSLLRELLDYTIIVYQTVGNGVVSEMAALQLTELDDYIALEEADMLLECFDGSMQIQ